VPSVRTSRDLFDKVVLDAVENIDDRWHRQLGLVEFAVEETPILPADWGAPTVPLATLVPATGSSPARIVMFRRPIELRCETTEELMALVRTVLVEQIAAVLGRSPEDIDPD
jgi:predicted Zn-dependent protease with MMP-like domain